MARLRTIKPEFWSSEQIMELSVTARLAFIGLWNFCDDGGVHPASFKTLKAEVFPSDEITVEAVSALVAEMAVQGLVAEFQDDGKRYWFVTGWKKHQKIDKPTYRHPRPSDLPSNPGTIDEGSPSNPGTIDEGSPSNPGTIDEGSTTETRRDETKGIEIESANADSSPKDGDKSRPPCPHKAIIALYHEILPEFRMVREWGDTRSRLLAKRWRESPDRQTIDWWRDFFGYVRKSRFLMGQTTGRDGRSFDCDLEWLIRPTNFAKVVEGKFEDATA